MADCAHRTDQPVVLQIALVVMTSELTAAIRMQDHRIASLPLPDRHLHGPDDHVPVLSVVHRPAHDPLVKQVQHDAQVQLAFAGLELGDVGDGHRGVEARDVTIDGSVVPFATIKGYIKQLLRDLLAEKEAANVPTEPGK